MVTLISVGSSWQHQYQGGNFPPKVDEATCGGTFYFWCFLPVSSGGACRWSPRWGVKMEQNVDILSDIQVLCISILNNAFVCLFVCLSVCMSVSALQVTVFVVGSWFLAWGILAVNPKKSIFFCFLTFWDLTYLWLFLDFWGVFCYISSVNFERVCRSNQMI